MTELAKVAPVVGFLGAAVYGLWKRVQDQDKEMAVLSAQHRLEIGALNDQYRLDQKEHAKQLLESSRHMETILREFARQAKAAGRNFSPYPGSTP